MGNWIGWTYQQWLNVMDGPGNAEDIPGAYLSISAVPPPGLTGYAPNEIITSESPAAGTCDSATAKGTIYLSLPPNSVPAPW